MFEHPGVATVQGSTAHSKCWPTYSPAQSRLALIYKHETHTFVWHCYASTKRIVYASFGAAIQARNACGRLALIFKHEAASIQPPSDHRLRHHRLHPSSVAFTNVYSLPPPHPPPPSSSPQPSPPLHSPSAPQSPLRLHRFNTPSNPPSSVRCRHSTTANLTVPLLFTVIAHI